MVTEAPTQIDKQIEQLARLGPEQVEESRMTEAGLMTISGAGRVLTYHSQTGEPTPCNRNMLLHHLRKTLPDGGFAYTLQDPGFRPRKGQVKCMLHPDVRLPEYDSYGFPVCMSAHIPNNYEMRQHMKNRHRAAFQALELMREERQREEDRQFQRELLGKATALPTLDLTTTGTTVSMEEIVTVEPVEPQEVPYGEEVELPSAELTSAEVYAEAFAEEPDYWPPIAPPIPPYECEWPGCPWKPRRNSRNPIRALYGHWGVHARKDVT